MATPSAVRTSLGLVILVLAALHAACSPRLDEQQVRLRLVTDLQLSDAQLRIRSITPGKMPVAAIDYGGAVARIQFRRQDDVWVIEAVERDGRWEPADRALPKLARELAAGARAAHMADVMPRYARTLKLLVGWSTLLGADCTTGLPTSQKALLGLHAMWHRTLFVSRPGEFAGEFHNPDLFLRDAWWRPFALSFSASQVNVRSSGQDGRMDTADDVQLTYTRRSLGQGMNVCRPAYLMPADVVEVLGRTDAPPAWNCADLIGAFKQGGLLTSQ